MIHKITQSFSSLNHQYYDIVIAGAGPVGVSLACALAKSSQFNNSSILLIDRISSEFKKPEIPE